MEWEISYLPEVAETWFVPSLTTRAVKRICLATSRVPSIPQPFYAPVYLGIGPSESSHSLVIFCRPKSNIWLYTELWFTLSIPVLQKTTYKWFRLYLCSPWSASNSHLNLSNFELDGHGFEIWISIRMIMLL